MSELDEMLLQKLNSKIESLSELFTNYENIKMSEPCFDVQLFAQQIVTQKKSQINYQSYLAEIKNNYQKLANFTHKKSNNTYIEQINYLTELIVNQINALQREVATLQLRKAEKNYKKEETLFEQYSKNLDYLRRLEAMKYELKQANQFDAEIKQKITAIEQRIYRCKEAISSLEQKIESNDKHDSYPQL